MPSIAILGPLTLDSLTPGYDWNFTVSGNDTVTVNDIAVTTADIPASNGVIHSISDVLLPDCATKNIVDFLEFTDEFSTAFSLTSAAGLLDALRETTPNGYTLFAPHNDAFDAVSQDFLFYLEGNRTALTEVLRYHVVPNLRIFDTEFATSSMVDTLNGDVLDLTTLDVVDPNALPVSNGDVYAINTVLIPPSLYMPEEIMDTTSAPVDTMTPASASEATSSAIILFFVGMLSSLIF
jgi:uncharacterized surface protein with fasciclin (FAS1) repeats